MRIISFKIDFEQGNFVRFLFKKKNVFGLFYSFTPVKYNCIILDLYTGIRIYEFTL